MADRRGRRFGERSRDRFPARLLRPRGEGHGDRCARRGGPGRARPRRRLAAGPARCRRAREGDGRRPAAELDRLARRAARGADRHARDARGQPPHDLAAAAPRECRHRSFHRARESCHGRWQAAAGPRRREERDPARRRRRGGKERGYVGGGRGSAPLGTAVGPRPSLLVRCRLARAHRLGSRPGRQAAAARPADPDVCPADRDGARLEVAEARARDAGALEADRFPHALLPARGPRLRVRRHDPRAASGTVALLDGGRRIDAATPGAPRASRLSPAPLASRRRPAADARPRGRRRRLGRRRERSPGAIHGLRARSGPSGKRGAGTSSPGPP